MEQEYVDLVDVDDHIIQPHMTIEEAYIQNGYYLRWVQLIILNNEGKLWIPRRHHNKRVFPWALDFSAGGHVQSGESYIEAIVREAQEEILLTLNPDKLKLIHRLSIEYDAITGIKFHANTYEYHYDGDITPNPEDISEANWFYPSELHKKLLSPEEPETKTWLPIVLEYYLK